MQTGESTEPCPQERPQRIAAGEDRPYLGRRYGTWTVVAEIKQNVLTVVDESGRQGVMKVIGDWAADGEASRRFDREIAVGRRLSGRWTPRVYLTSDQLASSSQVTWFVQEHLPYPSLAAQVRDHGRLVGTIARTFVTELWSAVSELHTEGIQHGDLSGNNILLDPRDGRPRIVDFGLGRPTTAGKPESLTQGVYWFTPGFGAPEQLTKSEISDLVDVWGWGATTYYALTGRCIQDPAVYSTTIVRQSPPIDLTAVPNGYRRAVRISLDWDPRRRDRARITDALHDLDSIPTQPPLRSDQWAFDCAQASDAAAKLAGTPEDLAIFAEERIGERQELAALFALAVAIDRMDTAFSSTWGRPERDPSSKDLTILDLYTDTLRTLLTIHGPFPSELNYDPGYTQRMMSSIVRRLRSIGVVTEAYESRLRALDEVLSTSTNERKI